VNVLSDVKCVGFLYAAGMLMSKYHIKVKVNEADLYSAFIEVPYSQGAQIRITQCYLQTTPYNYNYTVLISTS